MLEFNKKNYEKILFVSFIFTSILLIIRSLNFYFYLNSFGGHEWYTAEWLIHYSFGFVRRGMFGSLIVNLPFESDQSLIFLTFFLHTLYILYLLILIFIFVKNKQNSLSYLLLFSPAFVFFHTTNYEAIFRKELLGLLAFSLIVFSYLIKFRNILFFTGWIHGDLQFEFEKLNTLYDKLNRNDFNSINIFYKGIRINRSKLESFISYCMGLIASIITSHKFYEINAQPTVFSSNLLEKVIHPPIDFSFDTYIYWLALTNNYKIVREKYSFPPRVYGSSKWNFGIISRLKFSKNLIKYFFYLRKIMPN